MKIDLFKLFLLGEFSGAKAYLDEMHSSIPHARKQALFFLKDQAKRENWNNGDFDVEVQSLEAKFDFNLPRILAYSFITYLHSLVEVNLSDVAKEICSRRGLRLKYNEIAGRPIDRAKIYLTKVAELDSVSNLEGWKLLIDLKKIRNVVVHRGGKLGNDKEDKKLLKEISIRLNNLIEVSDGWENPDSFLTFDYELCSYLLDNTLKFFGQLLEITNPPEAVSKI